MHFVEKEPSQKRADFVSKLKSNKILRVPGAYNPLTAKLIEEIGYDAVYVSGGVMANDLGFPELQVYLPSLISTLVLSLVKKLLKLLKNLECQRFT